MEHTRIDEGVDRPRVPAAPWPTRKPPTAGKLGKNFDATIVLQRYLHGEEIGEIADSLGVHPKALNYHLLKENIRDQWREAQVAVSLAEKQEAESVLRSAPDALSLARAREVVRSAQWDLERLEGRLFGAKQEVSVTIDHQVTVEHSLASNAGELMGRIRKGNVAALKPVIESTAIPVPAQPIDT